MLREIPAELSIIIPVYNEIENVESLFQEIVNALVTSNLKYEVVFVDDGSSDGTAEKLISLSKHYESLRVICHQRNFGQSAALVSGARAAQYSVLLSLDGDGQNDPADIPRVLEHCRDFKTVILGNRRIRDDSFSRKLASRVANHIRQYLLKDDCLDTGCSLKLFPREAFLALPHFNHLHRYLPALFKRAGFKLINLPVNHRPRQYGVSKYGLKNRLFVGIYDLIGVRWLLKRPCAPEVKINES